MLLSAAQLLFDIDVLLRSLQADPLADAAVVWGIVTNFEKVDTAKGDAGEGRPRVPQYTVDVLAPCVPDEAAGLGRRKVMRPVEEGTPGAEPTVVALPLDQVRGHGSVFHIRLSYVVAEAKGALR